ncbi:OTU-domain-containing protein [Clavulina sp. PMI_390]|nr:OTU-domain-containing protein [Clavulina sp. PMI_390]
MSVPIRLRGPKGTSTIQVSLEGPISDLQQAILSATDIPPTSQEVRSGYPPTALTLIPSLPVSSLGLQRGDTLTVSSNPGARDAASTGSSSAPVAPRVPASGSAKTSASSPQSPPVPRRENSLRTDGTISAPNARSPPINPPKTAEVEDSVPVDGGYLVLRVVPDDNSCLFSSIAVIFEQDINMAPKLRQVVADAIRKDPVQFDEAILGRSQEDYISTILKPSAWGGAIELMIFADHYKTEISSFDVESGRCYRFGEGKYDSRCIVMYSGIHYDATSLAPTASAPPDFHTTVFPIESQSIFQAASKLATKRREKKAYTNTATFDLRCQVSLLSS